ncbi:MAG: hypothetical protein LBB25_03690 [Holosporaceae bacterium]|jgi:hypothetical protein|nr:hypothetical protein [Holosporaceae bacterium]
MPLLDVQVVGKEESQKDPEKHEERPETPSEIPVILETEPPAVILNENKEVQENQIKEETIREEPAHVEQPLQEEIASLKDIPPLENPTPPEKMPSDPIEEKSIPEELKEESSSKDIEPLKEESKEPKPLQEESEPLRKDTKEESKDVKEELVPQLENKEDKPPPKNQVKSPKPKKRNRKALMEVIKNAEKKKAKEKNRKKMLEIVERASVKRKKNDAFEKMLNGSISNLKKASGKSRIPEGRDHLASEGYLDGEDSIAHIINEQIRPYWNVPSGIKDAEKLVIEVELVFNEFGEVIPSSVRVVDDRRYATDRIFRAAADSARRAILEVGHFSIPRHRLEREREYRFKFNVADALRRAGG